MYFPGKNSVFILLFVAPFLSASPALRNKSGWDMTMLLVPHYYGTCFNNLRDENLVTLHDGKSICRYEGKDYTVAEHFFDPSTCRMCVCMAPTALMCCQTELRPGEMPKSCEVDPAGRRSSIRPYGRCMAPLIEKVRFDRMKVPCQDRRLLQALSRTDVKFLRTQNGKSRIIAQRNDKSNAKRHSGDRKSTDLCLIAKLMLTERTIQIPVHDILYVQSHAHDRTTM